jgi:iron-sulfur cluster assembly protein
MLNLTPAAAEQILRAAASQPDIAEETGMSLRVAAKIEDGEIVYGMGFDEEREDDEVVEIAGVTLLIAPPSQPLLTGATLDFVEFRPGEFQFIFINPNQPSNAGGCASRSTGCGSCGGSTGGRN